jgi:hypothetical protein
MELTEFLLARIAEDEAEAPEYHLVTCRAIGSPCFCAHPARVLAECEATRRIVDVHPPDHLEPDICATCASHAEGYPCRTLLFLALPYADHPDFDEEWRS